MEEKFFVADSFLYGCMATYLHYKKEHGTMCNATVSYLLKKSKEAFLGALAKLKQQIKQLHL